MSRQSILRIVTSVPWSRKAAGKNTKSSTQEEPLLRHEPEIGGVESHGQTYGSVNAPGPSSNRSSRRASPEAYRREGTLDMVPEDRILQESPVDIEAEDEEEVEWDLEERGLYSGPCYLGSDD